MQEQKTYSIPTLPLPYDLETKEVLRQVNKANRKLAELKGVAQIIRSDFGCKYNHELLNGLFYHPYTKIDHVVTNMQISRQTASKHLERIVALGLLRKEKMGKENYYINTRLMNLFIEFGKYEPTEPSESIESVHVKESPNL